jgi:phosphatidylglycerophosphate synthase
VPPVRRNPIVGLVAQLALLAIIAGSVGLGPAGAVAGLAYGLIVFALLSRALRRMGGGDGLGPADWVTLARATLVGAVTALTVDSIDRSAPVAVIVAICIVALVLDAVDGKVARRTGTVSGLGARFDMEVDAFLILVLSLSVSRSMGGWVLAIGVMRYAYVAASWVLPWMRVPLPPRYWRKLVAALQGIALVAATSGVLPTPVAAAGVAIALALLVESFSRDVAWQWRHAPRPARVPSSTVDAR